MNNLPNLPIDVLHSLAIELDLNDIIQLCKTSSYFNEKICKNEIFWSRKLNKEYPNNHIRNNFKKKYKLITQNKNELGHLLLTAASDGYLDLVQFAIDHKADINFSEDIALRFAIMGGHLNVVKYLLANGADLKNAKQSITVARMNKHKDVINYLNGLN